MADSWEILSIGISDEELFNCHNVPAVICQIRHQFSCIKKELRSWYQRA